MLMPLLLCSLLCVRCGAMCSLQQLEQQVEDIVKVYEARLTERETTSLDPDTVQEDSSDLQVDMALTSHLHSHFQQKTVLC